MQDEQKQLPKPSRITKRNVWIETFWIICGIVLPLAAIIVEKLTEICARSFFDPTPTDGHLLLIALVPLTNLIGELLKIPRFAGRFTWLASPLVKWINGMAIGVAGFYTAWFFPVTALCSLVLMAGMTAILGSIATSLFRTNLYELITGVAYVSVWGLFWVGLLILPMAPFLSLLACYRTRSTLFSFTLPAVPDGSVRAGVRSTRRLFAPIACGLLALLAIEIPSTATRVAMNMAVDPKTSEQGLLLLRAFGNDDSMLRMCYERSHPTDILGSVLTVGKPVPSTEAREIYYRATGRPFNSRGIPASFRGKTYDWSGWAGVDDVFDADAELAGETVGGVVRGVTLTRSEMTGVADCLGNAAAINWDMEFSNKSQYQREARAQILLPPHAVVSNVLLWIDGQPRPAAFGSRGITRAAYRAVVAKKRDPLLVTTYGPDRILAQCFPVPPNGTMHIQLGITAPLSVQSDNRAYLTMPMFLERNFQVDRHLIHLKADGPVSNPGRVLRPNQSWALDGSISNADLSQGRATVIMSHSQNRSWHRDSVENGQFIVQSVEAKNIEKPAELVIVVDGSAALADDADKIAQTLKNAPGGMRLTLLRAGDKVEQLADNVPGSSEPAWANALANLRCQTFVGGQDDTEALLVALKGINSHPHSAILWLHGPQPVKIDDTEPLARNLSAVSSNVHLYELQLKNGPNRTIEALDGVTNVSRLPIVISPLATLEHLFSIWNSGSAQLEPTFKQEKLNLVSDEVGQSQVDLSPLWANEKISELRQSGNPRDLGVAVDLAKRYRIVTPVSGAVVLETAMDYQKYGLKAPSQAKNLLPNQPPPPPDPQPGPSPSPLPSFGSLGVGELFASPEPRDWVLLLCVIGSLLYVSRRRLLLAVQHER